ncbi:MAG: FAD-dependent oxidoreductase [Coriobacteriales bacterium]
MSFTHFPHVYQPLDIGSMHMKNRIQYSPIVTNHAGYTSGDVTNELFEFYSGQAKSGAALVTVGSTPIDFDRGRDFYACMSATKDEDIHGLGMVCREMHRYNCNFSAELTHAGQWAGALLKGHPKAWVPSLVEGWCDDPEVFEEINRAQMDEVIDHLQAAIRRCKAAGFDMVMVHMAHGNLFSAFLSTYFNHRTDEYGGSMENRFRYPLEVLEAAHEATGGDIPIEIRFQGLERLEGGTGVEERIEFLKRAQKYIDSVVVSTGTLFGGEAWSYNMPGYYVEPCCNVDVAQAFKEAVPDLCISVCGGISTLEQAEDIIANGKADVVAIAKALMAEPQFANKGLRGQEDDIRPCLRCLWCLRNAPQGGHVEGCAVNPTCGLEYRGTKLTPILDYRKAMVIGGGPAGMEATQVLAERGFDTVLYEKLPRLGGRLEEASSLVYKDGFRRYYKYQVRKTMECGARVVIGQEATEDTVRAEQPDVLILTVGGEPIVPPIPGIDGPNVVGVVEVDRGEAETGQKVVVCGAGLSGAECAIALAMEGKDVTLLDMVPVEDFYKDFDEMDRPMITKNLKEYNVECIGEASVQEFTFEGVKVKMADGSEKVIPCDTAVTAFGIKPNKAYIEKMLDLVPETYVIGDANRSGVIGAAINDAYWICREI